jgi:putative DNA primase/helicase
MSTNDTTLLVQSPELDSNKRDLIEEITGINGKTPVEEAIYPPHKAEQSLSSTTNTSDDEKISHKSIVKATEATDVICVKTRSKNSFNMKEIPIIDPSSNPERYTHDDFGMGNLFADTFCCCIRYVYDADEWYYHDGGAWREDKGSDFTRRCVKAFLETLRKMLPEKDFIEELSKRTKRETIIKEARDVYSISLSDFDTNPFLFNCMNGTINLKTGEFYDHNPDNFLSKIANVTYDPNAKCERWKNFINEIMCGDEALSAYLQKSSSYGGLSGDTCEECLYILYGPTTRNGKGTYTESLMNVLGDYARTIQPDSLAQRKANGSGPSADIARLAGVRFVNASELPSGMKLNAAIVKQITGGDTVTARYLYQNFFEYRPQFTPFINTNHLPIIDDDSLFSSGRLKLIPFDKHFNDSEQDTRLKSFFRDENSKSAMLNWLLEGYELYKAEGLTPPPKAEALLREYRKNSDAVGSYVENRLEPCDDDPNRRTKTSEFHTDFIKWAVNEDIADMSLKEFIHALRKKGLLGRDRKIGHFIKRHKIKK